MSADSYKSDDLRYLQVEGTIHHDVVANLASVPLCVVALRTVPSLEQDSAQRALFATACEKHDVVRDFSKL